MAGTAEPMKQLFDDLVKGGASAVRGLLGREEAIDFDCKAKADPTKGKVEKSDKELLGRTLSAFANSMGGLLLWGVDAREHPITKVDAVCGFEPIAEITLFKSEIARLSLDALMPRVTAVQVAAIPDGNPGSGYLAVYIERSERRPHRCEFGDKQYYQRNGSSSRAMQHFEIEDAFRRQSTAELDLCYQGELIHYTDQRATIRLYLALSNTSLISARFPFLAIFPDSVLTSSAESVLT